MTIESNKPQINLQDLKAAGVTGFSDGASVSKMPDHILAEKPKTIFAGMTKNDADYYGLTDEYTAANTDGKDGISQEEFNAYEAKIKTESEAVLKTNEVKPQQTVKAQELVTQSESTDKKQDLRKRSLDKIVDDVVKDIKESAKNNNIEIKVGMTKSQAEQIGNGVINQFNIADRDKDGVISESEFVVYQIRSKAKKINDITEVNLAQVHHVYEGTVEKAKKNCEILNMDFDENLFKLFDANGDGIVESGEYDDKSFEILHKKVAMKLFGLGVKERVKNTEEMLASIGCKGMTAKEYASLRTLNEEQMQEALGKLTAKVRVHSGMTRAEAELAGPEVLKDYEAVYNFATEKGCLEADGTIGEKAIFAYKQNILSDTSNGQNAYTIKEIIKTINSYTGEQKINAIRQLTNTFYDEDSVLDDFKTQDGSEATIETYLNALNIKEEDFNKLSPTDKGKLIAEKFGEKIQKDMDLTDGKSRIYTVMQDLASGKIPKVLLDKGYPQGVPITDPQKCQELAMQCVTASYVSTFSQMSFDVFASDKIDDKEAMINSLFATFEKNPAVANMLSALGIEMQSGDDKKKLQLATANNMTEANLDDVTGALVVGSMSDNPDAAGIMMENNPEYKEYISTIATTTLEQLINNGSIDSKIGSELIQKINEYSNNVATTGSYTGNSESGNATSGNVSGGKQTVPQWVIGGNQQATQDVMAISSMSKDYMASQGITNVGAQQQLANQLSLKVKNEMTLPPQLKCIPTRIKKIIEMMATNFDQVPDSLKGQVMNHVMNYFSQIPAGVLIDTMLSNENIQEFMFKHKFVKLDDLVTYVRKHPQLMEDNNKQMSDGLREKLKEYVVDNKIEDLEAKTQTT